MKHASTPLFRLPLAKIHCDLADITDIGHESQNTSDTTDWQHHREAIWRAVEAWYRTATQPFISICVRKHGEALVHRSIGHRAGVWTEDGMTSGAEPANVDTPVCLFSASKALTAMLMHGLAEDGLLDLDRPVAYYLPKFAQKGKKHISISDVLSHRSGFPNLPRHLPIDTLFDSDAMVEALCTQASSTRKAKDNRHRAAYHAVSGGFILGAIAHEVSGKSLNQLLRQRMVKPMGLSSLRYGATLNGHKTIARNYSSGGILPFPISYLSTRALGAPWDTVVDLSNRPEFLETTIPSVNAYSSSADWCAFMELLRCGGVLDGQRIFKAKTVKRAVAPATSTFFDQTLCMPMRYSEGLMLGGSPFGAFGAHSQQSFGHIGFINIFGWADPVRQLSVAVLSTGKPLLGLHYIELARVINAINA